MHPFVHCGYENKALQAIMLQKKIERVFLNRIFDTRRVRKTMRATLIFSTFSRSVLRNP
jgi:hypothetical protein